MSVASPLKANSATSPHRHFSAKEATIAAIFASGKSTMAHYLGGYLHLF